MSILIKSMEMPKNCGDCKAFVCYRQWAGDVGDCFCGITKNDAEAKKKNADCPLVPVPPHGVEVRHGHWVMFDHAMSMWNVWVCSECGYRRKEGWMHTEAGKKPEAQYCENCMAKMDGSVNDGT